MGGCSPRRCPSGFCPTSKRPKTWRAGSRPRGGRCTGWAARFGTALFPGGSDEGPQGDFDLTTDARPEEIERLVTGWADDVWTQGKRFGTIGARRGKLVYEITTHRAEVYVPESRKPEVTFGDDITVDLSRRDFTVNAVVLRLPDMELIDPFDGLGDLAAGRLRTPLDPEVSFGDDPLRMLRAARFAARFSLQPDPALVDAVARMAGRLSIVSAERIGDELDKMMVLDVPSTAPWFVVRTGLADQFLPESPGLALEQDPIHRHADVLANTPAVVDKTSKNRLLRLAALFHDVGKLKTRAITDGGVTFDHHEVVGARHEGAHGGAALPGRRRRHGGAPGRAAPALHTYPAGWDGQGGAPLRARRRASPGHAQRAHPVRLHHADASKARVLARRMDEREAWDRGTADPGGGRRRRSDPTGNQVMELLGVRPGPVVGRALAFLMELRLDEGPSGEEAACRLRAWWSSREVTATSTAAATGSPDPGSQGQPRRS